LSCLLLEVTEAVCIEVRTIKLNRTSVRFHCKRTMLGQ
jgi:hypothetical protein